eukprot:CAMPEP_0172774520 /NCGR_PEP_ID=MMETSP1074-20121228/196308_1 /TAXON_ID=2916 /ORGANISM="Ceratium fusus, Strain PA161109" /LENGTH=38 /DNA_ID= /DNA_START= /DNA_END= /DNA_ORIENTATION=
MIGDSTLVEPLGQSASWLLQQWAKLVQAFEGLMDVATK